MFLTKKKTDKKEKVKMIEEIKYRQMENKYKKIIKKMQSKLDELANN